MIRLTVRAFAELLHLPAHAQVRVLNEQKYPRRAPQIFRIPFYHVALWAIRAFYRGAGDRRELTNGRLEAARLRPQPRRVNNERALRDFEGSPQVRRRLRLTPAATLSARPIPSVELRLLFDLEASEQDYARRIFYNFRSVALDPEVARAALQIAHWVISENGLAVPIGSLEYVDLATGNVFTVSRQSQRTLRLMEENARIIATLWPSI